jgi:hypothetical protein
LTNSKVSTWSKKLPAFLAKAANGAQVKELFECAKANKLEVAGEKAVKYAVLTKNVEAKEKKQGRSHWQGSKCADTIETAYIAETVQKIGDSAFVDCNSLVSVLIEEGVTEIESYAFRGCEALESVVFPKSLSKTWEGMFEDCKNVKSLEFKGTIAELDSLAFYDSPLKNVKCADGDWQKPLFAIENDVLLACLDNQAENLIIPDGISEISGQAFFQRYVLKSVIIPNSVSKIGIIAFGVGNFPDDILF